MSGDFYKEWRVFAEFDYFSQLILLWLSTNAWYRSHYAEIASRKDREFLEKQNGQKNGGQKQGSECTSIFFYYRPDLWRPPDSCRAGSTAKLTFNRLSETVVAQRALPLQVDADGRCLVWADRIQHEAAIVVCALAGWGNG